MNERMLSSMARVAFAGILAKKEDLLADGREIDVEREGLAVLQMCFKALDMNICVTDDSLFETCLVKHVRPFFCSSARGREAAMAFASAFIGFLKEEGDGDLQLARMRTALYRKEALATFSALLKKQVETEG